MKKLKIGDRVKNMNGEIGIVVSVLEYDDIDVHYTIPKHETNALSHSSKLTLIEEAKNGVIEKEAEVGYDCPWCGTFMPIRLFEHPEGPYQCEACENDVTFFEGKLIALPWVDL